ncbi:MAG: hypothetical protein P8L66_11080 [Rhodospirillaceae bacterium]|nr:hypothetical protein [Rhodospirillaceae bacterium]
MPPVVGRINLRTQTQVVANEFVIFAVVFALWLPLDPTEAEVMYRVLLWVPTPGAGVSAVFCVINLLVLNH